MTTHQRLMQGTRVRGGISGDWYRVTVSASIDYEHRYCAGGLVALVSGQVKRERDSVNIACSRSDPFLALEVEVQ